MLDMLPQQPGAAPVRLLNCTKRAVGGNRQALGRRPWSAITRSLPCVNRPPIRRARAVPEPRRGVAGRPPKARRGSAFPRLPKFAHMLGAKDIEETRHQGERPGDGSRGGGRQDFGSSVHAGRIPPGVEVRRRLHGRRRRPSCSDGRWGIPATGTGCTRRVRATYAPADRWGRWRPASVAPKTATVGTPRAEATCMAPESLVRNRPAGGRKVDELAQRGFTGEVAHVEARAAEAQFHGLAEGALRGRAEDESAPRAGLPGTPLRHQRRGLGEPFRHPTLGVP